MKTVLITGANKGIGFETARQLAQLGYFVFFGSRKFENGQAAEAQLKAQGLSNVSAIELDVTDEQSVQKAVRNLTGQIEALDILINNAGIAGIQPQSFADADITNLRDIFDTNFFGAVMTTKLLLPLLRKSAAASIINISSEVGSLAVHSAERNTNRSRYHIYGSSKTALNAFTVMLANELYEDHILVNSVTPGYTATDLNQFQGAKSVEQGAKAIVNIAALADRNITGQFFKEVGEVEW